MKNLLFLLVALTPTPSSAREAILDVFSPEAKPDFAVLAPQLRGSVNLERSVEPLPAPVDSFSPELNRDFELVPHSFTINPYAPRPAVPSWMRAGASFIGPAFLPFRPSQHDPLCQSRSFFPRYGISSDAQARRTAYFNLIVDVACDAGVPVVLFDALLAQESRYRPLARSSAGAMGMAQLMPGTAQYLRVTDPWNVRQNLVGGARYLREQLDRFGTWELALAAYNAGPGRVDQFGGIPPFRETRNYVRTIMGSIGSPNSAGGLIPASATLPAPNPFRRAVLASFEGQSDVPEH
ncbi:MAG: lytic transglycosylase domain-containing protein [Blastomonas fulva]|uniref:lytic transglycosylase domain-containing protein n=1 Tax=Blastomonas fulva TaxID=1550728 RepID=UPI0024E212CD|nr:lytic transglycosylase domain-containing protein [Blastomonas fulva]MDK2758694.1 lytic transglycosylase domain-containing protein [Blastomonas fulva]